MEVWKSIANFDGLYQVSNLGRIRSLTRVVDFGMQKRTSKGKVLKPNDNGKGYLYVNLSNKKIKTREYIHRLVSDAFIPNPHCKPEVNHKDGNKSNNRVDNLEWVTGSENRDHAYLNGLRKGEPTEINITEANMIIDLIKTQKYTKKDIRTIFKISETFYYKLINSDVELLRALNEKRRNRLGGSGKKMLILDKESGETYEFASAKAASIKFGFYDSYFSEVVNRRNGETERFRASYVKKG